MSHHISPNPVPPWFPNANPSSSETPSSVPGLNAQSPFEYNRTAIPGLSFAGSTQSWANDAAAPVSQPTPTDRGLGTQEPNTAPRPDNGTLAPTLVEVHANADAPVIMEDDMEEGELSESGFEDLYEPYLDPSEETNVMGRAAQQPPSDDEDYDPAITDTPIEPKSTRSDWPNQPLSTGAPEGRPSSICTLSVPMAMKLILLP